MRGRRSGIYTIVAIHSTARGPSLGGCRMLSYDDSRSAIRDALRLSYAMTQKAAVTGLPMGGGKAVIMVPPGPRPKGAHRRDVLLDFADTVGSLGGRYITAEDVGTSSRDMRVISEGHQARHGAPTAPGRLRRPEPVHGDGRRARDPRVLRARVRQHIAPGAHDRADRAGPSGPAKLATMCARAGARLVLADIDRAKRALADRLGARWTTPERALTADVDVLAPCALGGVLDHETVPALRCQVIAGAANNQLADDSVADVLAVHGILWAPDFVANAGGLINMQLELEGYDPAVARKRTRMIADTMRGIFDEADAHAITPLAAAMEIARRRLAEVGAPARPRRGSPASPG